MAFGRSTYDASGRLLPSPLPSSTRATHMGIQVPGSTGFTESRARVHHWLSTWSGAGKLTAFLATRSVIIRVPARGCPNRVA